MNDRGFKGIQSLFQLAREEDAPLLEIDLERVLIDVNSIQQERVRMFKWMAIGSSLAALFTAVISYSFISLMPDNINEMVLIAELYCY